MRFTSHFPVVRTFRYPLLPTLAQERSLESWRVSCQRLYNGALEERTGAWRKARKSIGYNAQTASLTELRTDCPEWHDIPVEIARSALRRVHRAFQAFFRRCKAGERPGYPRFRSRDRYDSFGIGRARIEGDRVHVPKLGPVRFKLYRPLKGTVRDVTLKREAKRWMVCIVCDLGAAPPKVAVSKSVGIDLGLEAFATLSNGGRVDNPRHFRYAEALLARRQRLLQTKKRGSKSRRRARMLVARAHEHVRNQRKDFAWKLAGQLVKDYDLIAHEDLSISRMVHGTLAKSIHDAAWGQFLWCLACKAEEAGKHCIAVDPQGTSQRCSRCGNTVVKDLSVREHVCDRCGLRLHRDHNAALNIVALGTSAAIRGRPGCRSPKLGQYPVVISAARWRA